MNHDDDILNATKIKQVTQKYSIFVNYRDKALLVGRFLYNLITLINIEHPIDTGTTTKRVDMTHVL